MTYLVLARKWRPQSFDDVSGQEVITNTLRKALLSGRIAHAYLFSGSRGVGKTTVARLLAKALSCEKGITDQPCGQCVPCQEIANGSSLDVVEIDGASNTGVDDIRDLREAIRYQPSSCRFKIFIIDEVHMLSTNAFNALLKTLEEPPAHVKFIFATTEPHKIPVTILSRCQRYDFLRFPVSAIVARVKHILQQENVSLNDDVIQLVAQCADGGMRDALSLLDQILSFGGENPSLKEVADILGVLDRQLVVATVDALVSGDAQVAMQTVAQIDASGRDLKYCMELLATEFRHLAIAKALGHADGIADLTKEDLAQIHKRAQGLESGDLQRLLAMAIDGIELVAKSQTPRLALELVFLKMLDRPLFAETAQITQAIDRLEALAGKRVLFQASAVPLTPAVVAQPLSSEQKWHRLVTLVGQSSTLLGHNLEHCRITGVTESEGICTVKVDFSETLHFQMVSDAYQQGLLAKALTQTFGANSRLAISLANAPQQKPESLTLHETKVLDEQIAQTQLEERVKQHPVVQKAVALFGGDIRSIKRA